jgi:hypothetical protein
MHASWRLSVDPIRRMLSFAYLDRMHACMDRLAADSIRTGRAVGEYDRYERDYQGGSCTLESGESKKGQVCALAGSRA